MAAKTKTTRAKSAHAKPQVRKLAAGIWALPCGLLDEWDESDSEYAPYVKRAVLDGYALSYTLLETLENTGGEKYIQLALSFRPGPSIRNLKLIGIANVPKAQAHVPDEWSASNAFIFMDKETGKVEASPFYVKKSLAKKKSYYSCKVTSDFFTIEFDYDYTKHLIQRFKYSPQPDLTETKTGKQRPHRKRDELPDPDSAADSEINRYDARFQARISKATSARVDAFLEATGMRKKDLTEQALIEFLDRHGITGGPDDDPSP